MWLRPPTGKMKLNDNAIVYNDRIVGLGFVIRNDRGEVIMASARRCRATGGSVVAEAMALRHDLSILETFDTRVGLRVAG
ncbi:hypothetical protein ACS0TY_023658 [Phlomoides rotata]